jgi:vesicle-associated membrane protein 7
MHCTARGEQIELLVEKTSRLEEQAIDFKHVSGDLKKHMWWKNVKLWIILGVVLVVRTSDVHQ